MTLSEAYSFLISGKAGKDLSKVLLAMRRELDGHGNCINDPTEHHFDDALGAVSLAEFLQGDDGLTTKFIIIKVVGPED